MRNLLEEGEYFGLAKLLGLKSLNMTKIYLRAVGGEQLPFLLVVYDLYREGFMTKEDAKLIIPARLVSEHSAMIEISENEIRALPDNPLSNEFVMASNLNEKALLAALRRGYEEKDPLMLWTTWPLETPLGYRNVWNQPELWRILLIETFCDGKVHIKKLFLDILKAAVNGYTSTDELLMINVSLFSFHLEILRMKDQFRSPNPFQFQRQHSDAFDDLEQESLSIFNVIKLKKTSELFEGFEANSAETLFKSSAHLSRNPFYYESRIELFVSVLKRLERIHRADMFADWFCNLFFSFHDIMPIMSLKLLLHSWNLFLSFSPSVEAICSLLAWFGGRISDEYRFRMAQEIPNSLVPLCYKNCLGKNALRPLELIPYELRKSEYLKKSRDGSTVVFGYVLESFWTAKQKPIVKILKVFELIETDEVDFYESIDTYFNLEPGSPQISLGRFLEIILNLFLTVKEWYIVLKKHDASCLEIIPSPLFPPKFIPILVQIIVRCRHLSCKFPFKIAEKYLKVSFYTLPKEKLQKFVHVQMRYLINTNDNRLPRLTKYYQNYFNELDRIQKTVNDATFLKEYYNLHDSIRALWTSAASSQNWDLTPKQLEQIEKSLQETILKSIDLFGSELHKRIGPVTFSEDEIYNFLFN